MTTYQLENSRVTFEIKNFPVIEYQGVLYQVVGAVTPDVDYDIGYQDPEPFHGIFPPKMIFTKPGNLYSNVDLEKLARPEVKEGDRLVVRPLNGEAHESMHGQKAKRVYLFPGRVTEIINDSLEVKVQ